MISQNFIRYSNRTMQVQYRLFLALRAYANDGSVLKRHSKFTCLHNGIPAVGALFECAYFDEGASRLAACNGSQTSPARALNRCRDSSCQTTAGRPLLSPYCLKATNQISDPIVFMAHAICETLRIAVHLRIV